MIDSRWYDPDESKTAKPFTFSRRPHPVYGYPTNNFGPTWHFEAECQFIRDSIQALTRELPEDQENETLEISWARRARRRHQSVFEFLSSYLNGLNRRVRSWSGVGDMSEGDRDEMRQFVYGLMAREVKK